MIDASGILAIALQEPEAERMTAAVWGTARRFMSAVNWLEAFLVVEGRHGRDSADDLLVLLNRLEVRTVAFDLEQVIEARAVWQRFGKGRHPASLNMGDCCAYAASKVFGEPLLYKGNDFSKTDVDVAAW